QINKDLNPINSLREREEKDKKTISVTTNNSLSDEDFKTPIVEQLCIEKNLNFPTQLHMFKNYYAGKELTIGLFENWIIRAHKEGGDRKNSEKDDAPRSAVNRSAEFVSKRNIVGTEEYKKAHRYG